MRHRKSSRVKGKTQQAHLERRVRVTFFLPAATLDERKALKDTIDYLHNQLKHPILPVTGFTHSTIFFDHSLFHGHWWSKTREGREKLRMEEVMFFLIDFSALAEEWKLDQEITRLKTEIHTFYKKHRSKQEEIWMVKEDIHRYA